MKSEALFWGLDPEYDGGCPCFGPVRLDDVNVELHCWRVGHCCEYSGLHVWRDDGSTEGLRKMAEALLEDVILPIWDNTEWTISTQKREY